MMPLSISKTIAIANFTRIIHLQPDNVKAYYDRGSIDRDRGYVCGKLKIQRAIALFYPGNFYRS